MSQVVLSASVGQLLRDSPSAEAEPELAFAIHLTKERLLEYRDAIQYLSYFAEGKDSPCELRMFQGEEVHLFRSGPLLKQRVLLEDNARKLFDSGKGVITSITPGEWDDQVSAIHEVDIDQIVRIVEPNAVRWQFTLDGDPYPGWGHTLTYREITELLFRISW